MMTRWHHSDSSKARSAEHESVKKKTLDLSSRSKWFSAGLEAMNNDYPQSLFLSKTQKNIVIFHLNIVTFSAVKIVVL